MKVVVVCGFAPSLLLFRGPLLREIARRGHDVVALAPPEGLDAAALAALGVRCEPIPLQRAGLNPFADAAALVALARKLARHRPDLVFAYTIKAVIYAGLAARRLPARRVAMITGRGYALLDGDTMRDRLLARVARLLYRAGLAGCDAVIFHNHEDRALFERLRLLPSGARRAVVNGSGVDLERFAPAPLPDGPPVCLFLGRLARRKGIFEFVEAARRVRRTRPGARFRILGWLERGPGGVDEDTVRAWEREGAVEYLGVAADVRPHLAAATLLALPSYGEGTPRSVLEAMATGRPVVVTDAPGCRAAVAAGENGLLVPVGDGAALAAAIERLVADPALARRLGRRGREIAEARYDVNAVNAVMLAELGLAVGP